MENGLDYLRKTTRESSVDSDYDTTLTPRRLPGRTPTDNDSSIGLEEDLDLGQLMPFQPPKSPNITNVLGIPGDSYKVESPPHPKSAATTYQNFKTPDQAISGSRRELLHHSFNSHKSI